MGLKLKDKSLNNLVKINSFLPMYFLIKHQSYKLSIIFSLGFSFLTGDISRALPPPEDIPEEILRREIITEARSPIDGKPVTAAEYAEIKAELAESRFPPQLDPELRHLIFLLRIRKMLRTITPF